LVFTIRIASAQSLVLVELASMDLEPSDAHQLVLVHLSPDRGAV
jgi:hypothetical protein